MQTNSLLKIRHRGRSFKLFVVIGAVAVGWTWSDGCAQALQSAQDALPLVFAQNPGTGGNMGSGALGGGVGSGMPSGQTDHGLSSTNNMDTMGKASGQQDMRMPQPGAERSMSGDPGRGGLPGYGSGGSTMGGGGTNSLGPTSGSGSTGMGMSGGAGGTGGSAGMGASGGGDR
jgi:hypothetical protein